MSEHTCKFCGDTCDLREFEGMEIAICGPCFRQWKDAIGHNS